MTEQKKIKELVDERVYENHMHVLNTAFARLASDFNSEGYAVFFRLIGSFLPLMVKADSKAVPTMAVTQINEKNIFIFNIEFMENLTYLDFLIVVKHEILHIVFNHIVRSKRKIEQWIQKNPMLNESTMYIIANYVEDALINSVLENALPTMVTHKTIKALFGVESNDSKSFEVTFDEIMNNLISNNKAPKRGDGSEKMPGSPNDVQQSADSMLDDLADSLTDEELEEVLRQMNITPTGSKKGDKQAMKDTANSEYNKEISSQQNDRIAKGVENAAKEHCQKRGNTPLAMTTEVNASAYKPVINMRKLLNGIFTRSGLSMDESVKTYRKPHRWQYSDILSGISLMGEEYEENFLISVSFDTSGSMLDSWFGKIINEVIHMFKSGMISIEKMFFCDAAIQKTVSSEKLEDTKSIRREFKRYGNGGTSVVPILKEFANCKSECLFHFTDGYIEPEDYVRKALTETEYRLLSKKKIFWVFINNEDKYKVFTRDVTLHLTLPNDTN